MKGRAGDGSPCFLKYKIAAARGRTAAIAEASPSREHAVWSTNNKRGLLYVDHEAGRGRSGQRLVAVDDVLLGAGGGLEQEAILRVVLLGVQRIHMRGSPSVCTSHSPTADHVWPFDAWSRVAYTIAYPQHLSSKFVLFNFERNSTNI